MGKGYTSAANIWRRKVFWDTCLTAPDAARSVNQPTAIRPHQPVRFRNAWYAKSDFSDSLLQSSSWHLGSDTWSVPTLDLNCSLSTSRFKSNVSLRFGLAKGKLGAVQSVSPSRVSSLEHDWGWWLWSCWSKFVSGVIIESWLPIWLGWVAGKSLDLDTI